MVDQDSQSRIKDCQREHVSGPDNSVDEDAVANESGGRGVLVWIFKPRREVPEHAEWSLDGPERVHRVCNNYDCEGKWKRGPIVFEGQERGSPDQVEP